MYKTAPAVYFESEGKPDVLTTAQCFNGTNGHFGIVGVIPRLVIGRKSHQFFGCNLDVLPPIDEVGKIDVLANPVAILEFEASGVGVADGEAEEEVGKRFTQIWNLCLLSIGRC